MGEVIYQFAPLHQQYFREHHLGFCCRLCVSTQHLAHMTPIYYGYYVGNTKHSYLSPVMDQGRILALVACGMVNWELGLISRYILVNNFLIYATKSTISPISF